MTEKNSLSLPQTTLYLPEGTLTTPRQAAHYLPADKAAALYRLSAENRQCCANLAGLEAAMAQGRILEATAMLCDCQTMAVTVDLGGGVRGVIPREELLYPWDGKPARDIAAITRVGKPVQFRVLRIMRDEHGRPTALLSRRAAQEECVRQSLSRKRPGDLVPVRVTHLEPFGAFVDVGCGVVSLIPIDAISVSRISHPRDRFRKGQYLPALIRQIDAGRRRLRTVPDRDGDRALRGGIRRIRRACAESRGAGGIPGRRDGGRAVFRVHQEHHSGADEGQARPDRFRRSLSGVSAR